MLMSEKITLYIVAWMIFLLFIASDTGLEIFFILIIIGFIIIKELTDRFTTSSIKLKMNAFIFIFMIVFILLIITRIINILEI
jgi:TRAP-type C4-dicarboxylate transport system permease small subunit